MPQFPPFFIPLLSEDAGNGIPGDSGAGAGSPEGESPKRAPRRRGSRGGRGRTRTSAAAAADAEATDAPAAEEAVEATPAVPAPTTTSATPAKPLPSRLRRRSRARKPVKEQPALGAHATEEAVAAPTDTVAQPQQPTPEPASQPEHQAPLFPTQAAAPAPVPVERPSAFTSYEDYLAQLQAEETATLRQQSQRPAQTNDQQSNAPAASDPNAPSNITPAPARVGMRPAVIRPASGGSRMSFSKGTSRQQFRPGGFRAPHSFTPTGPVGPVDPNAPEPGNELRPEPVEPEIPDNIGNRLTPPPPQFPQGRQQGNNQRGGQPRNQNNNRRDSRGGQGGQGGQGRQGGGNFRGDQGMQGNPRNQQNRNNGGTQNQGIQAGRNQQQPPQQFQQRPLQPRPLQQRPLQPPALPTAVNPDTQDLVSLPAQPLAVAAEAFTPQQTTFETPSPSDSLAIAPFAEDIELDETVVQQPRRREPGAPGGRDMLINVVEGEEIRIAVTRRGLLEELYMERSSTESHIGNIYKGRVTNVEPSIQAAFIDFGIGKNGFLHISDVHPQYFPKKKQPRMPQQRPPMQRPVQQTQVAPQVAPVGTESGVAPIENAEASSFPADTSVTESSAAQSTSDSFQAASDAQLTAQQSEAGATLNGDEGSTLSHSQDNDSPEVQMDPVAKMAEDAAAIRLPDAFGDIGDPETPAAGEVAADGTAASAVAPTLEEEADFGSAYNSEFEDDEEFGGFEGDDLDDGHMKPMEKVGRKTPRHERPPIQQCLRRGQEVIVQVIKEGIGTKGPTLTTYVSCPGRYLVMMPGMAQLGVSRKIEDLEQRRELKRTLQELNPPKNLGFIIRTAGTDVHKNELQGDLNYLIRMWKVIANRIRTQKAPVELYQESDLVIRTIRDVFSDEIDRIIVDNEQVASRIRDFLSIVDPRSAGIVELYTGTMPLFQKLGVEREIEKINSRRVELANGGSLVIDSTEALVAIDVNSGRYREQRDAELTAFNMNKEALKEIVRQLRLRDLGGVIVIDFIDMREERHKRTIEDMLRAELVNDRAKTKVLRMSQFCMIEMTRQRVRPSLKRSIYQDCPHCHGNALIKTPESVTLDVMRRLAAGVTRMDVSRIDVRVYPTVATFLLNRKRKALVDLEDKTGKRLTIIPDETLAGDQITLMPFDLRGFQLNVLM